MNEVQARQKGLSFTGHYVRSKEELAKPLNDIRDRGYKAYIVTVPDSKYSRGIIGVGYSIYAERKYFVDVSRKELTEAINRMPVREANALKDYEQALAELKHEENRLVSQLKELEKEL